MHISQRKWTTGDGWQLQTDGDVSDADLVLVFGERVLVKKPDTYKKLQELYPQAHIMIASSAGEILGTNVTTGAACCTAIKFDHTRLKTVELRIDNIEDSELVGTQVGSQLRSSDLRHVLIFCDGLTVNGTALTKGLAQSLPTDVAVTGGLVGDGEDFKETVVGLNSIPKTKNVIAIGLCGSKCHVSFGSFGGWDSFGPERVITKSEGSVLYELDNKPALALYEEYLGDRAKDLPSSGLLFPLTIRTKDSKGNDVEVVRTILGIDKKAQSITFAGDIPQEATARLMKANMERLIDGAAQAANESSESMGNKASEFALLISCIGRRLVLKSRTDEELEAVSETLGTKCKLAGFYSYGELCPTAPTENQCELHNQTMTITTFREDD